ncbi:MAG TPA: hypothetical protein VIQ00_15515, partial [Chitinophagaceae bacterium]
MKSILLSFSSLFMILTLQAQDCKNYYYISDNAEIQMTVYDRKGNESGKQTWKVSSVKSDGNGYSSIVESVFTDSKGKEIAKASGNYKCEKGVLMADMRMALPQQQMDAYKNTEVKADKVYIEYPAKMSTGQALQDADFKMEMFNNGTKTNTTTFKETNRKVEGKETITSPAGTWEAYKITYDGQMKITMGGIG